MRSLPSFRLPPTSVPLPRRRIDHLNLTSARTNALHSYRVITGTQVRLNLKQSSEFLQRQEASLALRILIIEDDEKIGATLLEVLSREGYSTTLSRTGEDGFFAGAPTVLTWSVLDLAFSGSRRPGDSCRAPENDAGVSGADFIGAGWCR